MFSYVTKSEESKDWEQWMKFGVENGFVVSLNTDRDIEVALFAVAGSEPATMAPCAARMVTMARRPM